MTTPLLCRALVAGNAEALEAIRDPDLSIAVWERPAPFPVARILSPQFEHVRFTSDVEALPDTLMRALDGARYPLDDARMVLQADIVALAERFAAIMRIDAVEIRLERVTGDACRKFHADFVTARLITTYAGRGTQWLDGDTNLACDCGEPHGIRELRAGDVAILKGRAWDEDHPAIHRSPPIAGSGEQRLLLVINPADRGD